MFIKKRKADSYHQGEEEEVEVLRLGEEEGEAALHLLGAQAQEVALHT